MLIMHIVFIFQKFTNFEKKPDVQDVQIFEKSETFVYDDESQSHKLHMQYSREKVHIDKFHALSQ